MLDLNEVLVPVDFSPTSRAVFSQALSMVNGEGPVVIIHHVIDPSLAEFAEAQALGDKTEVISRMRDQAEKRLEGIRLMADTGIQLHPLITVGIPFCEIIRKAEELAVDAVIMGKSGLRESTESLFFGSTAERVIRGCTLPVLVLPGVSED